MSIATAQAESYFDTSTLNNLRSRARKDPEKALEEVARQFESIFTRMMLKSMRDANFGNPLFDSDSGKFYQDMYDDQLSMDLAKKGSIGLADILIKQLSNSPVSKVSYNQHPALMNSQSDETESKTSLDILPSYGKNDLVVTRTNRNPLPEVTEKSSNYKLDKKEDFLSVDSNADKSGSLELGTPEKFVKSLWSYAEQASKELGIQPQALLAQAALETGWGKYVINNQEGKSSHNLFNIKADKRWSGESATKPTLEYEAGIVRKETANFRAYSSFEQSFSDYVDFIKNSPRYEHALRSGKDSAQYFVELQRAGYATDPHYAEKIQRIMNDKPMTDAMKKIQVAQLDNLSITSH